jgi:phosphatidylinositol glycan class W
MNRNQRSGVRRSWFNVILVLCLLALAGRIGRHDAVLTPMTGPDPADAAARRYRDKEVFVTGHDGTTPHEIFLLCLVAPVGMRLYRVVRPHVVVVAARLLGGGHPVVDVAIAIVVEFLTLILPMLVVQTSLLPPIVGPCLLLAGMTILASSMPPPPPPSSSSSGGTGGSASSRGRRGDDDLGRRIRPASLSVHRACVYVLTTIAILAVDFPLFPRRFCKTERDGYGWMDLGAASFVVIAGWTSAIGGASDATSSVVGHDRAAIAPPGSHSSSTTSTRRKFVRKCAPLLLLGIVRLATNKGLEYQEHVSEYGVHWNFFFTLCCVEGFMVVWRVIKHEWSLVDPASTAKYLPDFAMAMLMIVPYQLFLSSGGQEFVENSGRRCGDSHGSFSPCDVFVANREGILGVVGYTSLRLLSEAVARACLLPVTGVGSERNDDRGRRRRLFITSSGLWMAHILLTCGLGVPNSRRSTNAPFVLWSLAHNISLLSLIEAIATRMHTTTKDGNAERYASNSLILEAVNRFGLAVFLSSNLLTGLVNLTVDTLHSSDGKAVFILSSYLALVCGFALVLDAFFYREKID